MRVVTFVVRALTRTAILCTSVLLLVQVCIRQALGIETEVMTRRARLAEQRLAEIEEQLRQSILDRYTTVINREMMMVSSLRRELHFTHSLAFINSQVPAVVEPARNHSRQDEPGAEDG